MKPELEFVFELRGTLAPAHAIGPTPQGARRMVPITGGSFEGPRLRGSIMPGGADWQVLRGDGVSELEALYLLRTHDDVLIQVRNRGLRHGPEAVMQRLFAGEPVDPREYYFRAVPSFAAPAGAYEWLNRSIFLCSGARQANSIQLWMYRVA
ncbi:MAG TPA: DUF3237 domain-containing protein [Steroidobacteraceae bacterium]|nr:DUF3237 domain-containing protein [Steroidobacteraceae bacterium]